MFGGCARESQRKRGARGESERPGGVRGVADGVQGDERKQEVARGSRRWPRPLGRAPRLGPSGKTTGGVEMGWAVLGQVSGRQVS